MIIVIVMKKTLPFFAFATIVAGISSAVFTGCYKQTQYPNSISATIDTLAFSASGTSSVYLMADTATHNPQMDTIYGKTTIYSPGTAVQPSIRFIVPNKEGTYSFPSQATAIVITATSGSGGTMAASGQIVVLNTSSGRIQGNFTFTCADGTTVTNGQYTGIVGYP